MSPPFAFCFFLCGHFIVHLENKSSGGPKLFCSASSRPELVALVDVQSMYNRCTVDVPSMHSRCTVDVQSMYRRCTVDVQSMYSRCTVDVQSMYR
eukprot:7941050-Pyramimonas_sp.AAC.2